MNQPSNASLKRDTSNKENFQSPSSANLKAKKRMSAATPEQMRQLKVATENMSTNVQTSDKSKALYSGKVTKGEPYFPLQLNL